MASIEVGEINENTGNRSVCVEGVYLSIPGNTPIPLSSEVEHDLRVEVSNQKQAWSRQEKNLQRQREALNAPARRDEDGRMLNLGLLPGDEPITVEGEDLVQEDEAPLIAPEILAMQRAASKAANAGTQNWGDPSRDQSRAPGYIEDVTDRQRGWRP